MYKFNILRYIHNYIFRYIPWVIIGFLISFIAPSCEVEAMEYVGYSINPNNFGIKRFFQGTTYTDISFTQDTSSYGLGNIWYSNKIILNNSVSNSYSYAFTIGSNFINDMNNYDTFSFTFYTLGLNESSGVVTLSNSNGVCDVVSVGQGIPINLISDTSGTTEVGLNGYMVTCKLNSLSSNTLLHIPIKISQGGASQLWIQNWWKFYNDNSSLTQELITQQQQQIQQQQQTNNKLDEMNDNITSSDVDTGALDDTNVNNDNGVLSAILTLPIDFFRNLINGLNGYDSCPNLQFTLPFVDYPVNIPCVRNLMDKLGSTIFWESIGLLCGGLTMFYYLIHLGKELSDMMTLKETRAEWGGL